MHFSTYLENIAGISLYPVVSLTVFTVFFTLVLIRIFSMHKDEIEHLENLPLKD